MTRSLHLRCGKCQFLDVVSDEKAKDWVCPKCEIKGKEAMESLSNDRFYKMFTSPQRCDFCQKKSKQIIRIILHPVYRYNDANEVVIENYVSAKKCKKCCQGGE